MAAQVVCPRCGAQDSFLKGFLPETCVCRVCQSQLDWREIPGCGPDCRAAEPPPPPPPPAPDYVRGSADSVGSAVDEPAAHESEDGEP
jgi:hypothetical protein